MKKISAQQIAATLTGRIGSPESELRVLTLFQPEAQPGSDVESRELGETRETLPKAA